MDIARSTALTQCSLSYEALIIHVCQAASRSRESRRCCESRHRFPHPLTGTELVPPFITCTTEASRRLEISKTAHRIITLFDATVVLLQKSRQPEGHGPEMAGAVSHQAETHLLWRTCNLLSSSLMENQPKWSRGGLSNYPPCPKAVPRP
jgi:hypothetical protein